MLIVPDIFPFEVCAATAATALAMKALDRKPPYRLPSFRTDCSKSMMRNVVEYLDR